MALPMSLNSVGFSCLSVMMSHFPKPLRMPEEKKKKKKKGAKERAWLQMEEQPLLSFNSKTNYAISSPIRMEAMHKVDKTFTRSQPKLRNRMEGRWR